jgi:DNA primase
MLCSFMRYTPSILDEIRARIPVSAVVGRRVKLTKAGREWKGLSPFNAERTPSFFVNDQKQRYFDFSSGKNGNIFDFLIETEGLSFPEAVERLAAEAGVALPRFTPEMEEREKKATSLVEVMELAAAFFESRLMDRVGAEARRYLLGRDLQADIQRQFRIGYAPAERFALRDHLAGKNVTPELMMEAGLLIHGDEIAVPYDRFRDRVMFPIADARGRIIAFGGRALQADVPAKYLNSPETPLFHKGATLYNLHNARKPAHDRGTVIAVEGYIDVIAMTRAGFSNAVAPLGTALTEDQMMMLWRMAPEPIMLFDGDNAGKRAAYRALDVAMPHIGPGKTLRFAFMSGGKDPDELLRSHGPEAVKAIVERTSPFVDVLFQREMEKAPLDTPERKVDLRRRLLDCIQLIQDEAVKNAYRDEILERLRAMNRPVAGAANAGRGQARSPSPYGAQRGQNQRGGTSGQRLPPLPATAELLRSPLLAQTGNFPPREVALMMAAVNHPWIIERDIERFAAIPFQNTEILRLQTALIDAASAGDYDHAHIAQMLEQAMLGPILARLQQALNAAEWWTQPETAPDLVERGFSEAMALHNRIHSLHQDKQAAEAQFNADGLESSFQRLTEIVMQIAQLSSAGEESVDFRPPDR